MNKKMGRPKLPSNEAKSKILQVRLSNEEMLKTQGVAKRLGLSTSHLAREILTISIDKFLNSGNSIPKDGLDGS